MTLKIKRRVLTKQIRKETGLPLPVCARAAKMVGDLQKISDLMSEVTPTPTRLALKEAMSYRDHNRDLYDIIIEGPRGHFCLLGLETF